MGEPGRAKRCVLRRLALLSAFVLMAATSQAPAASAGGLVEALAAAYANNPQLAAERARLKATDEQLAIAQSGYRPTISGTADFTLQSSDTVPSSPADGTVKTRTYALNLSQPIYNGGSTVSAVREADATIRASRENVRGIEQSILLDVATQYMNVIRDQAIVQLRERNVGVLNRQLRESQVRFDAGELTKTDVEQAKARLAGAKSDLALAKAILKASLARFERVVGFPAQGLADPGVPEGRLPATLDEAVAIAQAENPGVVGAAYLEQASTHAIDRINGQLLPRFEIDASVRDSLDPSILTDRSSSAQVTGRLTVPIYDAGLVRAQVRQAKQQRQGRLSDIESSRVTVEADVTAAWAQLSASRAQLISNQAQVSAAQTALAGVRAEEEVGQRTQLDILNAEQELLNARVALTSTKRDVVVNAYTVLATIGQMTAAALGLPVELDDPDIHYSITNGSWWDTTIEHEEGYVGYVLPQ